MLDYDHNKKDAGENNKIILSKLTNCTFDKTILEAEAQTQENELNHDTTKDDPEYDPNEYHVNMLFCFTLNTYDTRG